MQFFLGGRVCKTGHANWSNWSRPCWLHVDRLASTAIGISSMHSRANQSLHFFVGWWTVPRVPIPRTAWERCTSRILSTLSMQWRSITEAYWRSVTCLPRASWDMVGMAQASGTYGDPQQCFASRWQTNVMDPSWLITNTWNIATHKPSKGKVLFWTPGPPVLEGYMLAMYGRKNKRGGWWNYAIFIYSNILKFNW